MHKKLKLLRVAQLELLGTSLHPSPFDLVFIALPSLKQFLPSSSPNHSTNVYISYHLPSQDNSDEGLQVHTTEMLYQISNLHYRP